MFQKLSVLLSPQDKKRIALLFVFSIVVSIIEMVGVSAIMPFIMVSTDFGVLETNPYFRWVYQFLGCESPKNFILLFGVALLFFYIFRSLINLSYQYGLAKLSYGTYHELAQQLFKCYLGLSFKTFTSKNSAALSKTIINEASNFTILLGAVLFMFSEIIVVILIYGLLIFVDYTITLSLTILLAVTALIISGRFSKIIKKEGQEREKNQKVFYEILNSSFGNFKLIKLQSIASPVMDRFLEVSYKVARANIIHRTLLHIPRLMLEAVGFSIMVLIVSYLVYTKDGDVKTFLPLLSTYVLALYRLLPSINRILDSYNYILFYHKSLEVVYEDLQMPIQDLGNEKLNFQQNIELKGVNFSYTSSKPLFENLSLNIQKGKRIAFIGESGGGKSTLVDIIIGLYRPQTGEVCIDSTPLTLQNIKSWRSKVGYIPQNVYLFDGSVAENVVFGREYNEERIVDVLKQAGIYEMLLQKEGIETQVGEGGILFSGGQKQRVAIARALYADPEILVLDEATSALDIQTESKIMESIYAVSQHKTLLIIAHRLSTIEQCDHIYKLENGRILQER
ncbi:ABC transporter ATP-binding protein [Helicobacter monodelphidis]|uniref:ABC transporter ATP-binding protein/permease n=1 Tax=Helicobacter sp. 15-1451 TaxID=2004995 RepID=UPI000DCD1D31|nr:ABC transporter ATP-binding protein [Helicobacter sp. 15-1451]RAX57138.1 ABC transporter ATP-binding protein [Helicobacter sp. 15-1451]